MIPSNTPLAYDIPVRNIRSFAAINISVIYIELINRPYILFFFLEVKENIDKNGDKSLRVLKHIRKTHCEWYLIYVIQVIYNITLNGRDIVRNRVLGNQRITFSPIMSLLESFRKRKRNRSITSKNLNRKIISLLITDFRRKNHWRKDRISIALAHRKSARISPEYPK